MSTTVVTYPIVTALVEAEKILGADRQWKPVNEMQTRFLKEYFAACRHEKVPEIESLASWDAAEITAFLTQRGFPIKIPPFGPRNFGTASVLDLLVEWMEKGHVTTITREKLGEDASPVASSWLDRLKSSWASRQESRPLPAEGYPAVLIASKHVAFFRAARHKYPIASLKTKSQDRVYMTMLDDPHANFDLVAKSQEFSRALKPTDEFEGLIFPMVDLDQRVDVDWLVGLETTEVRGELARIDRALQQTRLRMNELGARAESAVVLTVSGAALRFKPPHIINRPFLIWFERKGLSKPLFVGHITEEDWRNPGELTK
ncbi:MAG: hypothetical protein ABSG54_05225 [Terriglobia bacterium]|jgi:hypothetical protein